MHVAAFCALLLAPRPARGWVYPEHRTISRVGLERLDPERRAVLDELWAAARNGHEARLCEQSVPRQASDADCVDYTAWPALGGDHSCSAAEMLEEVLSSNWVLRVERVGARLGHRLAAAQTRARRINALRDSDIQLQRADRQYATRAGSNNAHFLLALPSVNTTPAEYATAALAEGAELNALAVYSWYHGEALAQAHLLAASPLTEERAQRAAAALADEAFALHFLEDSFAAGHVAGTWGSAALRKGTHDYYNEHGLATSIWTGERVVLTGDAWMRPEDRDRAAASVARSVEQLLDAARGARPLGEPSPAISLPAAPGALDICRTDTVQRRRSEADALLAEVLAAAPVPTLASGLGAMPRFRSELGPFVGMQAAARGMSLSGGFGETQDAAGVSGGLELGARVGIGLEGVMDEAGDGLVFLDVGLRRDGSSTSHSVPEAADPGALGAAIPARFGYELRLRAPFWLVPFDLLILAPVLALVSPVTLQSMAVMAGNGGLIPWQAGIATPIGRFQFILGREIAATLFGSGHNDRFVIPLETAPATQYALLDVRSVQIESPLLEYRPFRTFSSEQSSSLVIQALAGLDIPFDQKQVGPAAVATPDLRAIWFLGLRLSFDWRYYFLSSTGVVQRAMQQRHQTDAIAGGGQALSRAATGVSDAHACLHRSASVGVGDAIATAHGIARRGAGVGHCDALAGRIRRAAERTGLELAEQTVAARRRRLCFGRRGTPRARRRRLRAKPLHTRCRSSCRRSHTPGQGGCCTALASACKRPFGLRRRTARLAESHKMDSQGSWHR